ncbi:LacI family DNA-binding transcriptional regulator [Gynuella sunshinyii]|uniref:Transcriptional regulator n=1 Tax=Gynuella sunshinyii YC6258 TaxID=1445510 RepID=A0A0C5VD99_9GAMM|nr:LacI family DNA-binding transcriptional regulator [Gynuella sunshinyii]AJQ92517.1 transcriptional regulator [Gynuella sunshinyii YC6258]
MKKLTLKDVAAELKVSTATVSNAFNRPDQLSAKLRSHILDQCRKLGYFGPNAAARSLKMGNSGIIGVALSDRLQYNFSDPIASRFLSGLAETFDNANINLLLLPSRAEFYESRQFDSFADGFVLYGNPRDPEVLDRLLQHKKPIVTVDFDLPDTPFIHINNELAAYQITYQAFTSRPQPAAILGLKLAPTQSVCRISNQTLFDPHNSISRRRLEGYQKAIREINGHRLGDEWIWTIPENSEEYAYQAVRECLMCYPRPEVLLCMSDTVAICALRACEQMNLKVPKDIRIAGFDDIPAAANYGLTTIHQPQRTKGKLAAEMILGLKPMKSHVISTELVVRTTC